MRDRNTTHHTHKAVNVYLAAGAGALHHQLGLDKVERRGQERRDAPGDRRRRQFLLLRQVLLPTDTAQRGLAERQHTTGFVNDKYSWRR